MKKPALAGPRGVTASILAAAAATDHPDAEILQAWERLRGVHRRLRDLPSDFDSAEHERIGDSMWPLVDLITAKPARTVDGALVKLRLAFAHYGDDGPTERFVMLDEPRPSHMLNDGVGKLLWTAIETLEQLAIGRARAWLRS